MTKGPIVTIGGNVPLDPEEPIFIDLVVLARRLVDDTPLIAIIPTASQEPEKTASDYESLFEELGAKTEILNPEYRDTANHEDLKKLAQKADAFFFTGGNQMRITTMLGGTKLLSAIKERHDEGAIIAGTSAGAACLTHLMIAHGESEDALLVGELELSHGLGFIENVVIDTHFTARGRFPRLIHVVAENPGVLGIGIGENTAVIWDLAENRFDVIGSRNLVIVDGLNIRISNKADLKVGEPLCVDNITIHILSDGCTYDLETRKIGIPKKIIEEPDVEI